MLRSFFDDERDNIGDFKMILKIVQGGQCPPYVKYLGIFWYYHKIPEISSSDLKKLDDKMEKSGLFYARFMDDWVVIAPTRWKLRTAICIVNETLNMLRVKKHPDKTFIGKVERGFNFLGYFLKPGILRVAVDTIKRFANRIIQLYEQGADEDRIGEYVRNWHRWVRAGLVTIRRRIFYRYPPPYRYKTRYYPPTQIPHVFPNTVFIRTLLIKLSNTLSKAFQCIYRYLQNPEVNYPTPNHISPVISLYFPSTLPKKHSQMYSNTCNYKVIWVKLES